jgi:GNAT superfamily N-acetyltransferase
VLDELDAFTVEAGAWSREARLRDGTPVLLRTIRPSDRVRLAEGLRRLSPASRFLRFHAVVDELSDAQLDVLTDIDHVDHEAVVALDRSHPDRPGVGVARYLRDRAEPHVAEAAITVADDYHGQGAGTILLGALAGRARANGVRVFRSYVLDGNVGMLGLFDDLGAARSRDPSGLWRIDLEVPDPRADDPLGVPDSPAGRAFLAMADEDRFLASILPPVWSRLRRRRARTGAADDPDGTTGPATEAAEPHDAIEDPVARTAELAELRNDLDAWLAARADD